MAENWCHNCRYHRELPDNVHCAWCLEFFADAGRMPLPGDKLPELWERKAVRIADRHFGSLR